MSATYTMTLDEVLEQYPVFKPQPIVGYDELIPEICDQFGQREINYETPQLFIRKLNHKLKILAPNYNKMVASEMIEFEPLITDFMTTDTVRDFNEHTVANLNRDTTGKNVNQDTFRGNTRKEDTTAENETVAGKQDEIQAKLIKNLLSKNLREESSKESNESTHAFEVGAEEGTSKETDNTVYEETTGSSRKYNENVTGSEVTNQTVDTDSTTKEDSTTKNNQTGGDWTERGSDRRHGLDVNSDTPNAMLFNQPPNVAVYGTGRSHYEGQVEGDGVNDFPEAANIDRASYDMGSDDSPWFNYATGANNTIGHSTYDKSGTQTYNRDSTGNTTTTGDKTEATDKTVDTTKDTEGKESIDGIKNSNEDVTKDIKTTKDYTKENTGESGTVENANRGQAENSIEDGKEDALNKQTFANTAFKQNLGVSVGADNRQTDTYKEYKEKEKNDNEIKTNNDDREKVVRRGRTMRSPSALLQEYRETLTYNARMWLFSELDSCFLQVY